ncbi:FAD-dependent oxidoreductase [Myxococcota bacterium]|nr:FAD-dependent oxidoreductase [Myxococcota bacterium]
MTDSRTRALHDYSPIDCDVAIAGAELSGLVAGALLASKGLSVVVVDEPPVVGGRGGALEHRGYWIDGGHRAGRDVTDLMFSWWHGAEAAEEAGVEVHVRPVSSGLRIHLVPAPGDSGPGTVLESMEWTPEGFANAARGAYACPEEALPDFLEALNRFTHSTPEQQDAAFEMTLGEWLPANVPNTAAHAPLLNMVRSMFSQYPERASAGRLMKLLDLMVSSADGDHQITGVADDPEFGGTQGLMEPFARRIEECGGRILLDHRPVAVEFDGERAAGLVATGPNHMALRIRARHTIVAYPIWSALDMLPDERVSAELRAMSEKLEDHGTTGVGWVAALSRMPRRADTGAVEDYEGWNRMLVGPERDFSGGFHFPSLGTRQTAPEGKHILSCFILNWIQRNERPHWPTLDRKLQHAKAYLHSLYEDLDECIEWEADRFVNDSPAVAVGWYWAPVKRHELCLPEFPGLYFASSTLEGDTGTVDGLALAGLDSARSILAEHTS